MQKNDFSGTYTVPDTCAVVHVPGTVFSFDSPVIEAYKMNKSTNPHQKVYTYTPQSESSSCSKCYVYNCSAAALALILLQKAEKAGAVKTEFNLLFLESNSPLTGEAVNFFSVSNFYFLV